MNTRHHKALPGQRQSEELCNPFSLQEGRKAGGQSFLWQGRGREGADISTFHRNEMKPTRRMQSREVKPRGEEGQIKQPHLPPWLVCLFPLAQINPALAIHPNPKFSPRRDVCHSPP